MLTVHQLEVLVAVAQEMSIRAAAERLLVSQPAVSASLAALEREVGVDLFRRRGRGIEITEAGRIMVRYTQLLLGLVDEAVAATRQAGGAAVPLVRLGATTTSAAHVLTPLLARLRDEQPSLQFALEVGNRGRIWQLLASREIELGLSTRPPVTRPFVSLATRANEYLLVSKPGLVWPGRLAEVTWLVREEGSGTRAAVDEVVALLGISPSTLVIGSDEAIRHSAEAGLGVALLPADSVADGLRRRTLVQVHTKATPLLRPWHVVARSEERLQPGACQLLRSLVALEAGFAWTTEGLAVLDDVDAGAGLGDRRMTPRQGNGRSSSRRAVAARDEGQ